jgi:hypothetical protein
VNDCGLLKGKEFIVTDWYNGDRVPGGVDVEYRDGGAEHWSEDNAPKVTYLGKGKRIVTIVWPDPK